MPLVLGALGSRDRYRLTRFGHWPRLLLGVALTRSRQWQAEVHPRRAQDVGL